MPEVPAEPSHAATAAPLEDVELRRELPPVLGMAALFLVSIGLAMASVPTFEAQDVRAFEDSDSLANPLIYLVIVLAFTLVILLIAKYGRRKLIQYLVLGATFMTINYVTWPFLNLLMGANAALGVSLGVAVLLIGLLYKYPEWYVVDAVGVLVSAGAAAIFGISFGLLPSLVLLSVFAIYDAIAVYRTKHMIDLADSVLELRLPILFVVPKTRRYSFLREETHLKEQLEEGADREAMFMGLGDVVIPGVLIISALHFLNPGAYAADALPGWLLGGTIAGLAPWVFVSLATLAGTMVGYAALMVFVLRGNPQAGLPLLNGGAIVGFLASLLPLYGIAPLTAQLCGIAAGLPGC